MPKRPAGAATAIGLVPSIGTRARVGATSGLVLVSEIPIRPPSAARIAYHPAIP